MEAPSSRSRRWRGAAVGTLVVLAVVAVGVVGLALYELLTGGAFFAQRGGGSVTLVAQFVLLMVPAAMMVAAVLIPIGAVVGWLVSRR